MAQQASTPPCGLFISFEGGDGVGKSTQIARLADHLGGEGRELVTTREPGGSPGGEAIRDLLVNGAPDRWTPMSEALMMYAARAEHLAKVINPARARGAIVLCDRFADSTMAYQGLAGALGVEKISALHDVVVGEDGPDLTFIFDLPADEALSRAAGRGDQAARFEAKGGAFQKAVRAAFLQIAKGNPHRCVIIDASQSIDAIADEIRRAVEERLVNCQN